MIEYWRTENGVSGGKGEYIYMWVVMTVTHEAPKKLRKRGVRPCEELGIIKERRGGYDFSEEVLLNLALNCAAILNGNYRRGLHHNHMHLNLH